MKFILSIFFLLILSKVSLGQEENSYLIGCEIPFEKIQYDSINRFHYFSPCRHKSKIIFIDKNNKTFKIVDTISNSLLSEGGFFQEMDHYSRHGKVIEYYKDGKIRSSGYYYRNQPIGLWQYYYPNGHLNLSYSKTYVKDKSEAGCFGYCNVGLYEEYYDKGNLKISGCYQVGFDTGLMKVPISDPPFEAAIKTIIPVSQKFGRWIYYKQNGEIEKIEDEH